MPPRPLPPQRLQWYLTVLVGGVSIGMYGTILARFAFGHDTLFGFANKFDPRWEASFHAWLGSALLAGCAALLACISNCPEQRTSRFSRHWAGLALGFLFLSADEATELHEKLIPMARAIFGQDSAPHLWALFGLGGAALLVVIYRPFLRDLPPWLRARSLAAAIVYLGGALGMELLGGAYGARFGMAGPFYVALAATEETLELAGAAMYLVTLYRFVLSGEAIQAPGRFATATGTVTP